MDRGKGRRGQAQRRGQKANPLIDAEVRRGLKESKEVIESTLPRKAAIASYIPVPQTDTGR